MTETALVGAFVVIFVLTMICFCVICGMQAKTISELTDKLMARSLPEAVQAQALRKVIEKTEVKKDEPEKMDADLVG